MVSAVDDKESMKGSLCVAARPLRFNGASPCGARKGGYVAGAAVVLPRFNGASPCGARKDELVGVNRS